MEQQTHCDKAIAALITSTRRRKRPLSLVEIAEHVHKAEACMGSLDAVADAIGLSRSMLRRFLLVDRLDSSLRELVALRAIDSIDSVAELGSLPVDTQHALADALPLDEFDTEDIRGCVRLLNHDPQLSVDQVIDKVRASKTVRLFVYEFVVRDSMKPKGTVERNVSAVLGANVIAGVELHAATGRLKLYRNGRDKLSTLAKEHGFTIQNFVQHICEGDI